MKKISVFLTVVLLFSMFKTVSSARGNIPVGAEVSDTPDGALRVAVYVENADRLVSLKAVLKYASETYTLKEARASTHTDPSGDEVDNVSGLWVFGNLADGSGCVGAFVSYSGVNVASKTEVCEFIIASENGDVKTDEIVLSIEEFITDDNNEENDIFEKTVIPFDKVSADVHSDFDFETDGKTSAVTKIKTADNVVFIPLSADGLNIRSLKPTKKAENPFFVFDRNVLSVADGVFSKNTTVVAPLNSAPVTAVQKAGGKYLGYGDRVTVDFGTEILYTDMFFVDDVASLFVCTADIDVVPSCAEGYLGTGTLITLKNGENSSTFTLCVKGDVNGDSVCDVLDVVSAERCINGFGDLGFSGMKSADYDLDGDVTVRDYVQLVNSALGSEYKLFEGIPGDLNGDFAVDVLDLFEFTGKINNGDLTEKEKLDFNGDGIVNSADRVVLCGLVDAFN